MTSHHVFLSYDRQDTDLMTRIRDDLRVAGLTVYVDDGSAAGTSTMNRVINDRLRNASVFICLLSPDARASEVLIQTLAFAASLKKPLYFILAHGDEPSVISTGYEAYPLVDIREDYGRIQSELIQRLLNDFGLEKTLWKVEKSKLIKALEKFLASAESPTSESKASPASDIEIPSDVSQPLKRPRQTSSKDRARNLLLLLLLLISLYFLWLIIAPMIGQ
jgi:hypothetical protein